MNRKTVLLLVILTLLLPASHAARSPFYSFNSDLNEGISQLSVRAIFQDSRGYLWFGTRNGLNRFNGKEYVIYRREDGNEQSLSNNMVSSVTEDRDGNLWIATGQGLNRLDLHTDRMERYFAGEKGLTDDGVTRVYIDCSGRLWVGTWTGLYLYDKAADYFRAITLDGEISDTAVSTVLEDSSGRFWIATYHDGVYVCDNRLNVISHFTNDSGNMQLSGNDVTVLFEDSRKQVWAGCRYSGLNRINLRENEIVSFTSRNSGLANNAVRCLTEWDGQLLIGTFDGIFSFHPDTRQIDKVAGYAPDDKSLSHYSVYSFQVDRDSTLWVGTYAGGVNYLNKHTNRFVLHNPGEQLKRHTGIYGAMAYEPPSGLWIATEGYGLLNYDYRTGRAQYYLIASAERFAYQTNIIKSVFYENGSVWCGTTKGEIYRFDTGKKKFALYYKFPEEFSIYVLMRDRQGSLWVAGASARYPLTCFAEGKPPVTEFTGSDGAPLPGIYCALEEADGCFLLGSQTKGLFRLDTQRKQLIQYNNEATDKSRQIPGNYISALVRTRNHAVWVATYGGGIFELGDTIAAKRRVSVHTGLLDNTICSLAEGADGNLWMSTVNGVAMFDPATGEVRNFHRRNGIDIREFTPHSGIALPDGTLCFSGSNGFVTFGVERMKKNACIPPVVLEELSVNNRPVRAGDDTAVLSRVLDDTETVRLRHDQNNFSVTYQALNYVYAAENRYAYKLEGYDTEWNDVGTRNSAFYTNLGPGKYVFRVKASNNDGVWNEAGRQLTIIVQPPWWATWYAYLLYAAALATVTGLFIRAARVKRALRQQIRLKQQEKERQEEFQAAKIRLLTSFSHELRTPLMLIVTPFEELVKRTDLPAALHEKLTVIHKNARKLLLSVNRLLDLHTDRTDRLELKVSEGDICEYIREIYYAFRQVALANEIEFTLNCRPESFRGWFDKSLFEKVVFNLLSNAFEYTPDGGSIRMEVTETGREGLPPGTVTGLFGTNREGMRYLVLKVCNSGKEIPPEEAGKIFTPFYRIPENDDAKFPGSDIGLGLIQTVVKLHRGIILPDDTGEKGACFTVILPVSRSAFPDEQVDQDANKHTNSLIYNTLPPPPQNPETRHRQPIPLRQEKTEQPAVGPIRCCWSKITTTCALI